MVSNPLSVNVTGVFRDLITPAFQKTLKNLEKDATKLNKTLGGRLFNNAGGLNSLGESLSSIGNRLGFMAFQWKFMAGAAKSALDGIVGSITDVITKGSELGDSLSRALVFASDDISNFTGMTKQGAKDIIRFQKSIESLGSGQTIFGMDAISDQARELQKAFGDLDATTTVLPFAAALKTIEPQIGNEKLGTGLVSLLSAMNVNAKDTREVAAALDYLANVANTSTLSIDSTISSLGVSGQTAKTVGLNFLELGAIMGSVADVAARNKAGGRAASTPGNFANAFFTDLQKIADSATKEGSFARTAGLEIFTKEDGKIAFKNLIGITNAFRTKLGGMTKPEQSIFFSQLGLSDNSRQTILALLSQTTEEIEKRMSRLTQRGTLEGLKIGIEVSGQSQILRITAAIDSLKIKIAQGFAPALKIVADLLTEISNDKDFKDFLANIGQALAETVVPAVKTIVSVMKLFFNIFKKNKNLIKVVVGIIGTLVVAISGLVILATIGFYATAAAGALFAMSGQALTAAGAFTALKGTIFGLFRTMIPVALAGIGIIMVASSLSGVFDKDLAPSIFGIGAALTTLGIAFTFFRSTTTAALIGIPGMISGILYSIQNLGFKETFSALGTSMKDGIMTKLTPLKDGFTKLLGALGAAGPVGIAIAAAIAVGVAFAYWLDNSVKKSPAFQGGLVDYWNEAAFQLKAAISAGLRNTAKMFMEFGNWVKNVWIDITSTGQKLFDALWIGITTLDFSKLNEFIADAFKGIDIEKFFKEIADPDLLALNHIKEVITELKKQIDAGATLNVNADTGDEIENIIKSIQEQAGSMLNPEEIRSAINDIFGTQVMDSSGNISLEAAGYLNQTMTDHATKIQEATELLEKEAGLKKETLKSTLDNLKITGESTKAELTLLEQKVKEYYAKKNLTASTKTNTEATDQNTSITDDNSFNTVSDSKSIIEKIDMMKQNIIEIARSTNIISAMTTMVSQVNVMWAKLVGEGNRAAGKLASLKVSSSGKFSISDPGITASDKKLYSDAMKNFADTISHQAIINISQLQTELSKITTTLSESQNTLLEIAQSTNGISTNFGFKPIDNSAFGGKLPTFMKNADGSIAVDINVDGTFDINIQNGALTEAQVLEITDRFGKKIAEELSKSIGVQKLS